MRLAPAALAAAAAARAAQATAAHTAPAKVALTPPMGWMSWELFRCEIDCEAHPDTCISEALYRAQGEALAAGGYLEAGYNAIHVDDCWPAWTRTTAGTLQANATRFPTGLGGLASYLHGLGVALAGYTAEAPGTCENYPGSEGHEALDAATFAGWGITYMKVDGCNDNPSYYPVGYPAMGAALQAAAATTGRPITYSCSWPAYLGDDETTKPFGAMIAAGCNLWRNWDDIQCNYDSLSSIIDHYGNYSAFLQGVAGRDGPAGGHWNDPDMLLVGSHCLTAAEEETQMALWSVLAAPLIMGNDLRDVPAASAALLLNKEVIAVDQDAAGQAGRRLSPWGDGTTQLWARNLTDGVAVALYNRALPGGAANVTIQLADVPLPFPAPHSGRLAVRDLLRRRDLGTVALGGNVTMEVERHGTAFIKVTPVGGDVA